MDQAHQELDGRRLPRPVRAEITEDLAFGDREVQIEDAVTRSVVLRQPLRRDRCRHIPLLARSGTIDLNVTLRPHPAQPSAGPDGDRHPGGAAEHVLVEQLYPPRPQAVETVGVEVRVVRVEACRVEPLGRSGVNAVELARPPKELDAAVATA